MSDFYGKYGAPSTINDAGTYWNLNSEDSLFIQVRASDGTHVDYIGLSTPDWSLQKIKDACLQYAPDGYTLNATSPPDTYNPIVYDSPSGIFAIHVQSGLCQMNTIN
jgi:hypothetical protein